MVQCPKCSGEPEVVETATANAQTADLTLVCSCSVRWTVTGLSFDDALALCDHVLRQRYWVGATHAARGLFLEMLGRADEAYETYATAGRTDGKFDRAFCHERRAGYEAQHGWLRNALHSLHEALAADRRASGARVAMYESAIAGLAPIVPKDRSARDRELEIPAGFGAKNEFGHALTEDVIEVERLIRAERWTDAIAAAKALEPNHLIDAIGYMSRGVELAPRVHAIALQELVVLAYVIYASGSSSGGEGLARTADVERERARLRDLQ